METENRENDKKLCIKETFSVDRPFLRCTYLQQKVHNFFLALLRKGEIVLMLRKNNTLYFLALKYKIDGKLRYVCMPIAAPSVAYKFTVATQK